MQSLHIKTFFMLLSNKVVKEGEDEQTPTPQLNTSTRMLLGRLTTELSHLTSAGKRSGLIMKGSLKTLRMRLRWLMYFSSLLTSCLTNWS